MIARIGSELDAVQPQGLPEDRIRLLAVDNGTWSAEPLNGFAATLGMSEDDLRTLYGVTAFERPTSEREAVQTAVERNHRRVLEAQFGRDRIA